MAELRSRASVSVRPKKLSWRSDIGRVSRSTHSSRTMDGRHGGGTLRGCGEGTVAVAVEYANVRAEAGKARKHLLDISIFRASSFMVFFLRRWG